MSTDDELRQAAEGMVDAILASFRPSLVDAFSQLAISLAEPPPPSDTPETGPALRQARKDRGLTIRQLSERCGVPRSTLGAIERGETSPTIDTIERIVSVYGLRAHVQCFPKEAK